jgi:hypothetical protein
MIGRAEGGDPKIREATQSPSDVPESRPVSGGWDLPYYWSWYRTIFGERRYLGESRTERSGADNTDGKG